MSKKSNSGMSGKSESFFNVHSDRATIRELYVEKLMTFDGKLFSGGVVAQEQPAVSRLPVVAEQSSESVEELRVKVEELTATVEAMRKSIATLMMKKISLASLSDVSLSNVADGDVLMACGGKFTNAKEETA